MGTQAVGRAREIVLGVSIGAVIGLVTALIAGGLCAVWAGSHGCLTHL